MNTVKNCVSCSKTRPRGSGMAQHGYGNCAQKPDWQLFSLTIQRECVDFKQDDAEKVAVRLDWLNDRNKKGVAE